MTEWQPLLRTPIKARLTLVTSALEAARVENTLLKEENKQLREALASKKRTRTGVSVSQMGTHIFSTAECLEKVQQAEAATRAKNRKG